jgi:hypothetical protein
MRAMPWLQSPQRLKAESARVIRGGVEPLGAAASQGVVGAPARGAA